MENSDHKEPMIFDIHVTEGTHYEVGKQRAITFKEHYPEDIDYYITPMEGKDFLCSTEAHKRMMMIDKMCPGFTDEIQGFADEINTEPEKIVCYANSFHTAPNCCQFAVLPSNTSDGHFYVGRSYEYFVRDERSLCITRVKGKPKHMGFSLATNHYLSNEMQEFDEYHFWHSEMRYTAVWNTLLRVAPNVDHDKITNLMSTKYPFGPCCHFYSSGMGTLRSMIFDVTDKKLKVSFGPPDMNEWHSFDFDEPVGIQEVVCKYEDVHIDDPDQFWREM
ncbi:choloylglycine hydrolase [Paenibacillus thiaminolyticus]|uniref:Choloylglycine hydrolase n=1 Tax=Paenibacillus thiaminolyticus TaxID=49283 RepID=A0A3A3GHR2_PANTH|nr:choloylglycine hydrolase [Paenibacillus thiaminolyticus]RJG22638.1 choloylglycine hydrolase [Paenibacillus thiaminolyticus]